MTEDEEIRRVLTGYLQSTAPRRQQPGDITVRSAMDAWKPISKSGARNELARRVEKGELKEIQNVILDAGTLGSVWVIIVSNTAPKSSRINKAGQARPKS